MKIIKELVKGVVERYADTFAFLEEYDKGKINYRLDGRVEWVCPHGIGHTIAVPEKYKDDKSWWSHCCDGDCNIMFKDLKKWKKQ